MLKKSILILSIFASISSFANVRPLSGDYVCLSTEDQSYIGSIQLEQMAEELFMLTLSTEDGEFNNSIGSKRTFISLLHNSQKALEDRKTHNADAEIRGAISDDQRTISINYDTGTFFVLREIALDLGLMESIHAKCTIQE